jgi:hypothetical protein
MLLGGATAASTPVSGAKPMSNVIYTYATPEGAPKGTRERRVLDSRPKVDLDLEPSGHGVASGDRRESDPSCEAVDSCTSPLLGACAGLHQIRRLMCEVDRLRAEVAGLRAEIKRCGRHPDIGS